MSFFSRMFKRSGVSSSSRRARRPGARVLGVEPLEERRLLAIDAPLDFNVQHVPGPLGEEIEIKLSWTDSSGETGYEIQRSITGLDDPDGLWEGGFHENLSADRTFLNDTEVYRRYYFRIRSTGHAGSPSESEWSDPVYAGGTVLSPTSNIVVPEDNIVKVSAIAHSAIESPALPAKIELRWPEELAYEDADYKIYRKEKDETSFTPVADLDFEETGRPDYPDPFFGWVDEDLNSKTAYEYKVVRTRKDNDFFDSTTTQGIGYVYAGVDVPLDDDDSTIESPGTVILIVDNTQADALTAELIRLEDDLYAEGRDVIRHDVAPHDDDPLLNTHEDVRDLIIADYTADPTNVKSVFLIGHIPVPMSGSSSPDGHTPSRPMPADVFYGDMDSDAMGVSLWDLGSGNLNEDTVPADPVGGVDNDGKPVELMVGRVDMRDLPAFQLYDPDMDETELLRRYLDKDHAFRTGQVAVTREGRIRDNMSRSESSPGAWQTLSGFFGPAESPTELEPDNIDVNKWTDTTWPLVMGLRSIGSGDLDGEAVGRRGSVATRDLTCCSPAGKVRVVFKRTRTPYFSWETAL